jgi:hypothetical protein
MGKGVGISSKGLSKTKGIMKIKNKKSYPFVVSGNKQGI